MPRSLQKRHPRGWPQQKSFHLSLYKHYLITIVQALSIYHLLFHLTTGLPLPVGPSISLTYTFFISYSLFFLSIRPNHLKGFMSIHSTTKFVDGWWNVVRQLSRLSCQSGIYWSNAIDPRNLFQWILHFFMV